MKLPKDLTISLFACLLFITAFSDQTVADENYNTKIVIGPIVTVSISEADIEFIARVDTGAAITSINAKNIKASDGQVEYSIINKSGKEYQFKSPIVKESFVKNAESREKRYYVYLTLKHLGIPKKTLVNLNDRSNSKYKILLGRNWLSGSYIVDVDL